MDTPFAKPFLVVTACLTALVGSVAVGRAQTCVDDLTGRLDVCTANDVQFSQIDVLSIIDGCTSTADTATVLLRARLIAGAAQRYDIGMFFATDGGNAKSGSCFHEYLPPPLLGPGLYSPTSGVGPYAQLEPTADQCGDIEQGVETWRDLGQLIIPCTDVDQDGKVDIGTCVSWDNNTNTVCSTAADTIPGTGSKCRCERIDVLVLVPTPTPTSTAPPTRTATPTPTAHDDADPDAHPDGNADADRDRHGDPDGDRHRDGDADADADRDRHDDADPDAHRDGDADADRDRHGDPNGDRHRDGAADPDRDDHGDAHGDGHHDRDADADRDDHGDANPDGHADAHGDDDRDAHPDRHDDRHSHADADGHHHRDPDADGHRDGDADVHSDADGDADPDAHADRHPDAGRDADAGLAAAQPFPVLRDAPAADARVRRLA